MNAESAQRLDCEQHCADSRPSLATPAGQQFALSWPLRVLALCSGVVVLALLITARVLEPSPTGFGTHQQLGLPPCTSVALFGLTCPSCGMTTSWALITRGRIVEAVSKNVGGMLLAIIAMAYLPASCYFFFKGRSSQGGRFSLTLALSLIIALCLAVCQWLVRLLS